MASPPNSRHGACTQFDQLRRGGGCDIAPSLREALQCFVFSKTPSVLGENDIDSSVFFEEVFQSSKQCPTPSMFYEPRKREVHEGGDAGGARVRALQGHGDALHAGEVPSAPRGRTGLNTGPRRRSR